MYKSNKTHSRVLFETLQLFVLCSFIMPPMFAAQRRIIVIDSDSEPESESASPARATVDLTVDSDSEDESTSSAASSVRSSRPTTPRSSLEQLRAQALASMQSRGGTSSSSTRRRRRSDDESTSSAAPPTQRRRTAPRPSLEQLRAQALASIQPRATPLEQQTLALTAAQARTLKNALVTIAKRFQNYNRLIHSQTTAATRATLSRQLQQRIQHFIVDVLNGTNLQEKKGHIKALLSTSDRLQKLLVQCGTEQCPRFIPFVNYVVWGGCYQETNLNTAVSVPTNERDLRRILEALGVMSSLHKFKDNNGISAALLLLHKGYLDTLQEANIASNDAAYYAPLGGNRGNILLQMIRIHFGDIIVDGNQNAACMIPAELLRSGLGNINTFKGNIEQLLFGQDNNFITRLNGNNTEQKTALLTDTNDANIVHWLIANTAKKKNIVNNPSHQFYQHAQSLYPSLLQTRDSIIITHPELLFKQTRCGNTPLQLAVQGSDTNLVKLILTTMLTHIKNNPGNAQHLNTLIAFVKLPTTYKNRTPLHWLSRNAIGSLAKATELAALTDTIKIALMLRLFNPDITTAQDNGGCTVTDRAGNSAYSLITFGRGSNPRHLSCAEQGYTIQERSYNNNPLDQSITASLNQIAQSSNYTPDQLLGFLILAQYVAFTPGLSNTVIKNNLFGQVATTPNLQQALSNAQSRKRWASKTLLTINAIDTQRNWQSLLGKFSGILNNLGIRTGLRTSVNNAFNSVWQSLSAIP